MRQKMLAGLGRWAGEKTWWMLLIVVALTVVFGGMAGKLEMSMDLTSLLPGDDPMVDEFNYIFREFNGASTIFVVVKGEPEDMVAYAEHVSPMLEDVESWITEHGSDEVQVEYRTTMAKVEAGKIEGKDHYIERVEYKLPMEFIRDHGLMLIKPKDLKNTRDIYTDPNFLPFLTNLNNSLEKEYLESEEKISTTQRERTAVAFLDGIESWVDLTGAALLGDEYAPDLAPAAANAIALGVPYMTSPDRSMLVIMVEPTFNIMEIDFLLPFVNGIEELAKTEAVGFNVEAGLAGGTALGRDEYVAAMEDSMLLTLLALVLVFVLFVITFRMLSSPLLAILNLIIGITWAMGVAWLLVGQLNMFTAMMAVVLVGLGIDFSIHIISVFSEHINKGVAPNEAMVTTLQKVGGGIITGGITTAAAFLTLMIGRSNGISEFGLVCGVGLIVIMIATLVSMPTFLMLRERYRARRKKSITTTRDISYVLVGNLGQRIYTGWKVSVGAIALVTIILGYLITRVTMDYNYLNMEPVGLESIRLNDELIEKFNFSPDVTMMTALSLEENRRFTDKAKGKAHVSFVESITDYLPMPAEQARRRPEITAIAARMKNRPIDSRVTATEWAGIRSELERLEMNVIEIQILAFQGGQDQVDNKTSRLVGNPDRPEMVGNLSRLLTELDEREVTLDRLGRYNRDFGRTYRDLVIDMADTAGITVDDLPALIRDKHISRNGERFLLTVYPKGNVWDIEYLEAFTEEMLDVSRSISGTPPMFYFLLQQVGEDGRRASLLTILVVLLFLWADFRSLKFALIAMTPLVFGAVWMLGIMGLLGIQITLLNIMALPLIIGIGIDDGVHILHRYKIEGRGALYDVYRSTGKAIIITSLTTMMAFGSLVFATYRGFGSLGIALFIGVGACLLASLVVLPAVLAWAERKQ